MTTVPQEYVTSEFNEKNPVSLEKENSACIVDSDTITRETFSENEGKNNPETSLKFLYSEENNVTEEENNTITNISNCDRSRKESRRLFMPYVHEVFTRFTNAIDLIFNMIDSDINTIIEFSLKVLGVSQQRINKKLLKHLFLFTVLIVAFVHSRNDGTYQNFETRQLFSRHSLVTDFFHGELSLLKEEIFDSDITVVMYYAPWDRQSQNFVSHFLKAAQYHHEQVSFAAINCWLPKSECRRHYKLHRYPIVVLHVKVTSLDESLTIPYNGPLSAHHLIRFISKALRPFTYITNQAELLTVQLENQVIVLGYYDVGNFNKEYLSFYYAAISKLQFEHMSDVRYALITNPALAKNISFTQQRSIHLTMWNTTLVFPTSVEINLQNITTFVDIHLSEVVHWLHINGRKSLALNSAFQEGPFMVVFSPNNPYHSSNDPFQLIRSVALEYFNCHQSPLQLWLAEHFHFRTRAELRDSDKICRNYLKKHLDSGSSLLNSLQNNEKKLEEIQGCTKVTNICLVEEPSSFSHITWNSLWNSFIESEPFPFVGLCLKSNAESCNSKNESSNVEGPFRYNYSEQMSLEKHVMKGPIEDDKISKLSDWAAEEHCKRLVLGSTVAPPPIIKEEGERVRINGLSCKTNRTLKFLAVDSLLHQDFAQQLGVNLSDTTPKLSGSIIIDPEMEERYIMDQPLSRNNMASFVYNFTNGLLNRGKIFRETSKSRKVCGPGEVCILELNGNSYLEVTNKPRQAFVVMHYTHHCGACSAIGSTFLTCLHLTSGVSNLTFARIDISKNTLPWHLTFDTVPTIIFYPHNQQSQSRMFNPQLPVTVKNLMTFILAGLKPPERNSLALKLCDIECKKETASQTLLMKLKLQNSISVISSKLKSYIALLIELKTQLMQDPNNLFLRSKYSLYVVLKSLMNQKLIGLKSKLSHVNQVVNFYPHVPLEFSNQLTFETKIMLEKAKVEL